MTRPNNISTQPVTLRTNSENQVIVYAKQRDNNLRELLVDVRDFFGRIPSDISVRLNATLQDDSHIYLDGVIKDDYTVSIMLTNILLAEEGDVQCDVSFFDASGDLLLTTETFVIKVAASNYDPAATDAREGTPMPVVYVRYDVAQDLTDEQKETARNNIGAVDEGDVEEIIEPLIVGYNGEITLSGDETLVLEIKSGRLYHEGILYTGDIVLSDDGDNAVTLNVNKGFTYSEGALYTDTVKLSGDDSTLFISFENGLVKNIATDSPNLDGTVHYDSEQELTNKEKEVARNNIGINLNAIAKGCMLLLSFDDAVYEGKTIRAVVSDFRISNKPFILPQFYYIQEEAPLYDWDFEEIGVAMPGMYVISGGISRPIFTVNLKSGGAIRATISYATQSTGDRIVFLTEV